MFEKDFFHSEMGKGAVEKKEKNFFSACVAF